MKLISEMPADKLRGGYYSSPLLVKTCFDRVVEHIGNQTHVDILEPSAGDGSFVQFMPESVSWDNKETFFTCVEIIEEESQKCSAALKRFHKKGNVVTSNFFSWANKTRQRFNVVIGNPPFVRYQFVPKNIRSEADRALQKLQVECDGVANLWIPFALVSIERVKEGGAFAMVLPSELLSIRSAGIIRAFVLKHFDDIKIDLFPRSIFPEILQDVVVLSGRRSSNTNITKKTITFIEHSSGNGHKWNHCISGSDQSWGRYLLSKQELATYTRLASMKGVFASLGEIACIGVSTVTGANRYFTVSNEIIDSFQLKPWACPLMPRTADSSGLIYGKNDHHATVESGTPSWLLDFSEEKPDPLKFRLPYDYIKRGEELGLPERYKCRIRSPWYRVPKVAPGTIMMTKRSHQYHRLLLNSCAVYTTDTVYQGYLKDGYKCQEKNLVAGFHNSFTLLSAEIEGRSYGGGVLELIPSEVKRVIVPLLPLQQYLSRLDKICRHFDGQLDKEDNLVHATNQYICQALPEFAETVQILENARCRLRQWRHCR